MHRDPLTQIPLTRRVFLRLTATSMLGVGALATARPAAALTINPRSSWAVDRPPKGPLEAEDARFLLVHHSASRNGHTGADAPGILRSFYDFHTGSEKGWSDIAYNFLIDADGGIWEGRSGSIAGAVAGDATGGNQGYSQLVCVIGDYNAAQPSSASLASLVSLLAWMADKHGIATAPGSTVSFTSRGSNKWPAGSTVTTPTINGHRSMSKTTCPGDNLYSYVSGTLMSDVTAVRAGAPITTPPTTASKSTTTTSTTTTTAPTTSTMVPASTTLADPVPTTASTTTTTRADAITTSVPSTSTTVPLAAAAPQPVDRSPLVWVGGGLTALATAALAWRYRRMDG